MHRVHADGRVGHDRQEDRRHNRNQRRHIHKAAQQQQQNVDDEHQHILVARDAQQRRGNHRRNAQLGHHVSERLRRRQQRHHDGQRLERVLNHLAEVAQLRVAEDHIREEHRIHHRDCGGFRRGEDAHARADQNDHQRQHRQNTAQDDALALFLRDGHTLGKVILLAHEEAQRHHRAAQHNARHRARHEQRADGNAAARRQGIDDHVVARRDEH